MIPLSDVEKRQLEAARREKLELERLERQAAAEEEFDRAVAARNTQLHLEWEQKQAAIADAEKTREQKNRDILPELSSVAQFLALPMVERSKYYSAFGGDYMRELAAREKSGLSHAAWSKLRQAQPILSEEQEARRNPYKVPARES